MNPYDESQAPTMLIAAALAAGLLTVAMAVNGHPVIATLADAVALVFTLAAYLKTRP